MLFILFFTSKVTELNIFTHKLTEKSLPPHQSPLPAGSSIKDEKRPDKSKLTGS